MTQTSIIIMNNSISTKETTINESKKVETPRLKYAEVTIIKNVENSTFLNSYYRFIGIDSERIIDKEKDIILMTFEGEPPFDTKDRYVDLKFHIEPLLSDSKIGYMMNKEDPVVYHSKTPRIYSDGTLRLDFNRIHKENPVYNNKDIQTSCYNTIFYRNVSGKPTDVLFIARLNSSITMPRYVIAYDETLITKLQVIYVIRNMFLELFL